MQIAFVADPLEWFKIYKDSTYAMMAEVSRRGHHLFAMTPGDIQVEPDGTVMSQCAPVNLKSDSQQWFERKAPQIRPLSSFDAVVMRKDPPFDMEYIYATYMLELAQRQGARIFNRPEAIRDHNEKFAITEFIGLIAPTLVTRDANRIRQFHAEHADIILKPLDGMGGAGIFRVREDELNLGSIIETLTALGSRTIMVQRYIPQIVDGDKRVILIDGQPVPYCLARIPQGKEIRGNLAAGGLGRAQPLSDRDREIAVTVGAKLAARGLLLVGLDVIGDYLTEINVTSPTGFQEITKQSGFDVAAMFVDALERHHKIASDNVMLAANGQ